MHTSRTMTMEQFWRGFHAMWWEPMRENQKKARELFVNLLEDKIQKLWRPGCNYKSAAIVIVDFSVADSITLHVYEKAGGHKSDIITGSNREFERELSMWGHLKVSEEYGITIRSF